MNIRIDLEQMLVSPTIPLWFTKEEIEKCKQYAFRSLIEMYPNMSVKENREKLNPLDKVRVVNTLGDLFNNATEYIESNRK